MFVRQVVYFQFFQDMDLTRKNYLHSYDPFYLPQQQKRSRRNLDNDGVYEKWKFNGAHEAMFLVFHMLFCYFD